MAGPRSYSEGTKAALALLSRGSCYYPECHRRILHFEGGEAYTDYQIAHISDAREGNRYDPNMSDDDRRSFANLVLLCKPHHELIDKRHPEKFPSTVLREWKREREGQLGLDVLALGAVNEDELLQLLPEVATIYITASSISLGGEGGKAPGAGGGGGGVIGDGFGGPGGPGGRVDLDGKPGTAPGAGGGGGGAVGPDARAGEGGEGGEYVSRNIAVEQGMELEIHVGQGGQPGQRGEDSWVSLVNTDGSKTELLRAKAGRPGRDGYKTKFDRDAVPFQVTSALLADSAEVRDGLVFVLGGGWDYCTLNQIPGVLTVTLILILEPVLELQCGADISVDLVGPTGAVSAGLQVWVEYDNPSRPLRLTRIFQFVGIPVEVAGMWTFVVRCNGTEVRSIPLTVRKADGAAHPASTTADPLTQPNSKSATGPTGQSRPERSQPRRPD